MIDVLRAFRFVFTRSSVLAVGAGVDMGSSDSGPWIQIKKEKNVQ
jgi:hypothetical protein